MTEQELYEKLRDKVMNVMNEYPKEMFTSHNLKAYEAFNASCKYEKWDELFWKWCDDEFYNFTEDLKVEWIDFNKQIEQVGRTSSFYLGNRHCDLWHYYSYSWTYEDMCQEMLEKITDYYTKNNASLDIIDDRVELYSRWYNDESMTDEDILNDLVSSLCEDMERVVEWELRKQKVMYELLKEYKDNQVKSFEQRVADYAYYNSEEDNTEATK